MDNNGFDDIEMKQREKQMEAEADDDYDYDEETNFGGRDPNESIQIFDAGNPRFNRVVDDDIPDVRKDAGSMKKSMTEDRKKSFKKIFDVTLKKKYGPNSSILIDKTEVVKNKQGNVSIIFKGKKIGNVDRNNKPDLFPRKNKKYVDEFNDYMKKAKKEYENTPLAVVQQKHLDWDSFQPDYVGDNDFYIEPLLMILL